MSNCDNPIMSLSHISDVEKFVNLASESYLFKLRDSKMWVLVERGKKGKLKDYHFVVSGNYSHSKICKIKLISDGTEVNNILRKNNVNYEKFEENPNISEPKNIQNMTKRAKDPLELKKGLQESYEMGLKHVDGLMEKGYYSNALKEIGDLIVLYGSTTELILKQGMARIKESMFQFSNRNYKSAIRLLNKAVVKNVGIKNKTSFYNNIIAIINKSSSIPAGQKINIIDFIEVYDGCKDIKVVNAKIATMIGGKNVSPEELLKCKGKGRTRIIVQDHPSLSNLDWSPNIEESLPRILESILQAIFVKIPEEKLGTFGLKLVGKTPSIVGPNVELSNLNLKFVLFMTLILLPDREDREEESQYKKIADNLFVLYMTETPQVGK